MRAPRHERIVTEAERDAAEAEIVEQSKRIEFYLTDYSIELIANKFHKGEFFVPQYQREFTWEEERKSRFIESILMGLAIPFLFFWERPDGLLEIVDGSQRVRTLEEFVFNRFRLGELSSLPKLSGFAFDDLLESRRRKMMNRSIRGIVLNEHADEQARFDMFERINTSSKVANQAEVRRGALAGPFMNLVIELAARPDFKQIAPVPKKDELEREREELVIRFLAYTDGLDGYRDRPSQFIFEYAKRMNLRLEQDQALADVYRERFDAMVAFVAATFPHGFRRATGGKASPRARFEAISVGTYLALQEKPTLANQRVDVTAWVGGQEFRDITGSDGANAVAKLRSRTTYVRDRLLGR